MVVDEIVGFLREIGLEVVECALDQPTFLPGVTVDRGRILYDRARLTWPGDLLHEAGHVATTPAADRPQLSAATKFDLGDDLGAIAWSYAALLHLNLDPSVLFHAGGYMGNSSAFIGNFAEGHFVGASLLAWMGLTVEPKPRHVQPLQYPAMIQWLRD